jgi:Zn finger protein HypA/HybF involved in hydrogenase expression
MFEVPKPQDVWLFRCTECGWHSDINQKQINTCPNCGADTLHLSGTSEEIGTYLKRLILMN